VFNIFIAKVNFGRQKVIFLCLNELHNLDICVRLIIVFSRVNDNLASNSLLDPHQSGFTKRHSTETLLSFLYNRLVSAISRQVSCLRHLDVSAALDTVDHNILLKRLCLVRFY